MYRLPARSVAQRIGMENPAAVAGPPSPTVPAVEPTCVLPNPLPATVEITPFSETLRIRKFELSLMYTLPETSVHTPVGWLICACTAGPPSPLNPALPVPANVVITPFLSTLRTRLLFWSARYRFPDESHARPTT